MSRGLRFLRSSRPLSSFFVQQWLDTDTAGLGPEMPTQSTCARKSLATSPASTSGQFAFALKLLLSAVQCFVGLAVVLSAEGFAANATAKRSFIGVSPKMTSKVERACEAAGAKRTHEGCRAFLGAHVGEG